MYTPLEEPITHKEIQQLINTTICTTVSGIPYPQANTVEKIISVLNFIDDDGPRTANEIAASLNMDPRQGAYYADAARFIGLVNKKNTRFELTDVGKSAAKSLPNACAKIVIKQMLGESSINDCLRKEYEDNSPPDISTIESIIMKYYSDVSEVTINRRANCIRNWLLWIDRTTNDY